MQNAFIGWTSAETGFPADGQHYDVIPEPVSALLLGAGLVGVAYARKLMRAKESNSGF